MQAAMVASTPAMASAIRRVLSGLHSQKMAPGVDSMLLRLYEPLIFRCLVCPLHAPHVRVELLQWLNSLRDIIVVLLLIEACFLSTCNKHVDMGCMQLI